MTPTLTIIRGLPGSGKSYYGRHLAAERGCLFIEPDMLLTIGGKYHYTEMRYDDAVEICGKMLSYAGICEADVIYADVLPALYDIWHAVMSYGTGIGERVEVIDMPLLTVEQSIERNKHNVRREDIERMAAQWEPWERKQKESGNG
jgi:hypothetical protein